MGNRTVNVLDITIDRKLKFDENLRHYVYVIKANRKLTALTRTRKCLDIDKIRVLLMELMTFY